MRITWLVLLLSCTGPSTLDAGAHCDPSTCTGCCTATGQCLPGDTVTACGKNTCAPCTAQQTCTDQRCVAIDPPLCDSTTCAAGCCANGVCRSGREAATCGTLGAACQGCPSGQLCSGGACVPTRVCDLACAPSCCDGHACDAAACGPCASCPDAGLCSTTTCESGALTFWKVRIVSAVVSAIRPDGEPFDDKSDPDPMVCVTSGDGGAQCTLEKSDTLTPAWGMTLTRRYARDELKDLDLTVTDVDFPGQTLVEEFGPRDLRPRNAAAVQQWQLEGASCTLRVDVVPD